MGFGKSGKKTHDDEVDRAEAVRQSVVGTPGVTQATVRTAEIAYYRAAVASARSNGVDTGGFIHALSTLGVKDV